MSTTLTAESVASYLAGRPQLADLVDPDTVSVREVGDGNLNQVFICRDASGRSIVLKQSLPYVRLVGPSWPMTEERAAREAAAIRAHAAASEHVCRLIDYDADAYVLALEDLSDHAVLRTHFNDGGDHTGVAQALGRYVAEYCFATSFLSLSEEQFRIRAAASINTELCALTEDLIFTEPYLGAERNSVHPDVQPVVDRLQADPEWVAAAMAMKLRFLTVQEALLHGDLHSGSVFIRPGDPLSIKAFDSEFAFYGPIGFDLGLLWSNLLAAGVRALMLGEAERGRGLLESVQENWLAFRDRLTELWPQRQSPEKYTDAFLTHWLDSILVDSFGMAGCEAARRTIGLAKVSDIESLTGEQHVRAASAMLDLSRLLLTRRAELDFATVVQAAVDASAKDRT